MQEETVKLQIITPLFLKGANPDGPPELRPPSFRGELRYWLRATIGAVIGDTNLENIRKLEAAVFGTPDSGSPITVRIPQKPLTASRQPILPHHAGRTGDRQAFDPGQLFSLTINAPRPVSDEVWRVAGATLRMMLTFGGVGLRSRRGYGTLAIVNVFPKTSDGWDTHIQTTIVEAISAVKSLAAKLSIPSLSVPPVGPGKFPCGNQTGMIRIVDPLRTQAIETVTDFMSRTMNVPYLGGIAPRQASPLWVRPIEMNGQFGLLFMVLASNFTGSDYAQVKTFINRFAGHDISVRGWNQP